MVPGSGENRCGRSEEAKSALLKSVERVGVTEDGGGRTRGLGLTDWDKGSRFYPKCRRKTTEFSKM